MLCRKWNLNFGFEFENKNENLKTFKELTILEKGMI